MRNRKQTRSTASKYLGRLILYKGRRLIHCQSCLFEIKNRVKPKRKLLKVNPYSSIFRHIYLFIYSFRFIIIFIIIMIFIYYIYWVLIIFLIIIFIYLFIYLFLYLFRVVCYAVVMQWPSTLYSLSLQNVPLKFFLHFFLKNYPEKISYIFSKKSFSYTSVK